MTRAKAHSMYKGIKLIIVQICLSILSIQIIECCVKPNGYVLFFSLTFDIDSNYREGNQAHIYAANLNIDSRIGSGNGNVDGCCLSCDLDTNTYISTFAFWKGNRSIFYLAIRLPTFFDDNRGVANNFAWWDIFNS